MQLPHTAVAFSFAKPLKMSPPKNRSTDQVAPGGKPPTARAGLTVYQIKRQELQRRMAQAGAGGK
jgi:hypothetical protein